jgi:hypothetical protein
LTGTERLVEVAQSVQPQQSQGGAVISHPEDEVCRDFCARAAGRSLRQRRSFVHQPACPRMLDLTVQQALLATADEVIE